MTKKAFRFFCEDAEDAEEEPVGDDAVSSVEKTEEIAASVKTADESGLTEKQEAVKKEKTVAAVQTATENNSAKKAGKKAYHGKRNRGARKH